MQATEMLRQDHRRVEELLDQVLSGNTGSRTREEALAEASRELSVHMAVEEELLYPAAREALPAERSFDRLEDLEEHHVIKVILSELAGMDADHERFKPKVNVLAENVRHHHASEEDGLFPDIEQALSTDQLDQLGDRIDAARDLAPTRPHPNAPDTPPGTLLNLGAAAVDRVRDRIGG